MPADRRNFLQLMTTAPLCGIWLRDLLLAQTFQAPRRRPADGPIRLDHNESPYGPSNRVETAIRGILGDLNHYPNTEVLSECIATTHRVSPLRVVVGSGSTDVLRMAASSFLGVGKKLVMAQPTFPIMAEFGSVLGAQTIAVPLDREYAYDLSAILARVDHSVAMVYVCNPNNPTGTVTPRADLENFLSKLPRDVCVVIDEAYHHYAEDSSGYKSFVDDPIDDPRLIATRTFSTVYGLAGARLGYGIGGERIVEKLRKFRVPHNPNTLAIVAGIAALNERAYIADIVLRNANARQEYMNQAVARALRPISSHTNFIMMNSHNPAEKVIDHFRQRNILIGPAFPSMTTFIRVTLGTPAEMEGFWRVWDQLPNRPTHMH